ncbi:PucR family transcriptional regulator [Pseudonocardia adelaidensis]|uniref:Helix-turn-helix domain-containing protein n=1 Tax=Pseudonocardia adelaidensis TaxID=648754 RepID=A0ABP9P967_9PSEU
MAQGPPARQDRPSDDSIDVGALLAEPLLRNTLVAGLGGVHRRVQWCLPLSELGAPAGAGGNGDRPGPPHAGIVVHAHAADLRGPDGPATISTVAARGGVAVLVQTDPRDVATPTELPFAYPEARRAADDAGLPLALLPPTADYRTVSQLVATKVLAQATHVLQYSDRVHRSLGEILARGAGIPPLAYGMARMSEAPVMVIDLDGVVLAHEATSAIPKPDPAVIGAVLVQHLERLAADGTAGAGVTVVDPIEDGPLTCTPIIAPVMYGGEISGLAAVLEPAGGDPHDHAQRRIVAAEGAVLIGSEMLRIRSMTEAEERTRGDFVVGLVHGRFEDGQQLLARARHHGFHPDGRYAVCVAAMNPPDLDDERTRRRSTAVARAAEKIDLLPGGPTLATYIGGNLVVVRPVVRGGPTPDALDEQERVRAFAGHLRKLIGDRTGTAVRVAFGRVGTGARGVARSYREARTALALGRRVDVPPVAGYDELRIFVALSDLADSENGRTFAHEVLEPLRKVDGNARNLESVVLAYIAESGNLNAAARRLGLHRNTTLYKLDRVSRVLGMDIRSAETQFMVWLAHHIDNLVQVGDSLDAELAPPP